MLNPKVVQYTFTPDRPCYKQFFLGEKPPVGLRMDDDAKIRNICQPPKLNQDQLQTYYATMFDKRYGLAVFSAYKLSTGDDKFQNMQNEDRDWCETPGNLFKCMHKKIPQPSVKASRCKGFMAVSSKAVHRNLGGKTFS